MEFVSDKLIKLDRELSDLDRFTIGFVEILEKYSNYVLISGYVSILLGRARSSEDVDILVEKVDFDEFKLFFKELEKKEFYCLNSDEVEDIYSYLRDNLAVRFAKKGSVIPNMEFKFLKNHFDRITLNESVSVLVKNKKLKISKLEIQVAFKEEVLKTPKDIEDARHIRNIADLDENEIIRYKEMLKNV